MSFNGSGRFDINSAGQPAAGGVTITASAHNALTADLATGLSTCITKDGQTTVIANIPMSTFKFTGLGAGSARTDSANIGNIQDGAGTYVATVGGTADAITLSPVAMPSAYTAGQTFLFIVSAVNTGAVTVNVSSLGAKAITKNGTTPLVAGDLSPSSIVQITYDGTRFVLVSSCVEWLNIKFFGALGDDSTNDTTAIQNALNAAEASRVKKVYAPAGKYRITQIAIPSGIEFFGNWIGDQYGPSTAALTDAGTYFVQNSGVNDDAIVFNGRLSGSFYRAEFVYLHDFVLTKSGTSDTLGNGISARQTGLDRTVTANHSLFNGIALFERILVRGFPENGFYIKNGGNPLVTDHFYGLFNGGYGIKYEGLNYANNVRFLCTIGDGNKGGAPLYIAANTSENQIVVDGVYSEYRSDNPYGNTGAFGGASPYGVVVGDSTDTTRLTISNVMVASIVAATAPEAAIFVDCPTAADTPAITFTNCINQTKSLAGGSKKTLIDNRTSDSIPNTITSGSYSTLATTTPVIQHMSGFVISGKAGYVKPGVGDYGYAAVGTSPAHTWFETDAPSDEKSWFCGPSGGDFYWRTQTDAGASAAIFKQLVRTGNVVDSERNYMDVYLQTANDAQWARRMLSEEITLSTSGTTTDSSANLLPANSIIRAVVARVTVAITGATDWKLGDPTTSGRFTAANSTLALGTTDVGLVHIDQTGAAGPRQTSAAKVRITNTGTPTGGKVRVTVFFDQFVAPTS